jgi:regulatory protein
MSEVAAEAVDTALRALRHRDLSARELDERLRAKGFGESARDEALETLARTGLVDDARLAEARARSLAARGAGDAAIRHALRVAGVEDSVVGDALATLDPEEYRAAAIVDRRGVGPKTARYLRGKGFSDEVVSGLVAGESAREIG